MRRSPAATPNSESNDAGRLADSVIAGDRRALARAITLIQSTPPDHRTRAAALIGKLLPRPGAAVRTGISGSPRVRKSTFIQGFGLFLVEPGRQLALLA